MGLLPVNFYRDSRGQFVERENYERVVGRWREDARVIYIIVWRRKDRLIGVEMMCIFSGIL